MGIRRAHIGKGVVTKRHVEDALKFTALDHIVLCKGAGATITGNAGTTYAYLASSEVDVDPSRYSGIRKVEAVMLWNPNTTAGGLRIYNATDAEEVAKSEPGVVGLRRDRIDITTYWKGKTGVKTIQVESKGDGTTAPAITWVCIIVETGNV